jgi:hypothetical protein
MSLYPKFRDVHSYVGLVLMVPVMIIAGTGILLNHEKALGLKPELPKKQQEEKKKGNTEKYAHEKPKPPKAMAKALPGVRPVSLETPVAGVAALTSRPTLLADHAAAFAGALRAARDAWGDAPLEHVQLKEEHEYGLVIKIKAFEHSGLTPKEFIYSVADGEVVMKKGEQGSGYPLHKIIHDLHTGKVFSKDYGVLWSDISAMSILLLSGTGLVLYGIPIWKKRNKKKPAAAKRPGAARPKAEAEAVIAETAESES